MARPQKINYMFLRHRPRHLQPPPHKNFHCISSIHTEKSSIHCELSVLIRPSFAAILFVDWLVCILKVEIFSRNYTDTSFYSISFRKQKIKSRPPASFSKKKCLRNILLTFCGLRCILCITKHNYRTCQNHFMFAISILHNR